MSSTSKNQSQICLSFWCFLSCILFPTNLQTILCIIAIVGLITGADDNYLVHDNQICHSSFNLFWKPFVIIICQGCFYLWSIYQTKIISFQILPICTEMELVQISIRWLLHLYKLFGNCGVSFSCFQINSSC